MDFRADFFEFLEFKLTESTEHSKDADPELARYYLGRKELLQVLRSHRLFEGLNGVDYGRT